MMLPGTGRSRQLAEGPSGRFQSFSGVLREPSVVCRAVEDAARHREEQAAMDLQQRRASKKAALTAEPAAGQLRPSAASSQPC